MKKRLYPFSFIKHGHNIELAYNHQWIICKEMEDGERPWDYKAFEHLDNIVKLLDITGTAGVVWADGKTYGRLMDLSVWAECYRDQRNA